MVKGYVSLSNESQRDEGQGGEWYWLFVKGVGGERGCAGRC